MNPQIKVVLLFVLKWVILLATIIVGSALVILLDVCKNLCEAAASLAKDAIGLCLEAVSVIKDYTDRLA